MYQEHPEVTMTFLFGITKAPGLQGDNKTFGIVEEQTVFIQKVLVSNAWFKKVFRNSFLPRRDRRLLCVR